MLPDCEAWIGMHLDLKLERFTSEDTYMAQLEITSKGTDITHGHLVHFFTTGTSFSLHSMSFVTIKTEGALTTGCYRKTHLSFSPIPMLVLLVFSL